MDKYISAWTAYTQGISSAMEAALNLDEINETDIVWAGPSGDYVIASDPAALDEQYAEYVDAGMVSEYLHDEN